MAAHTPITDDDWSSGGGEGNHKIFLSYFKRFQKHKSFVISEHFTVSHFVFKIKVKRQVFGLPAGVTVHHLSQQHIKIVK